jgi:hypothetical protein
MSFEPHEWGLGRRRSPKFQMSTLREFKADQTNCLL